MDESTVQTAPTFERFVRCLRAYRVKTCDHDLSAEVYRITDERLYERLISFKVQPAGTRAMLLCFEEATVADFEKQEAVFAKKDAEAAAEASALQAADRSPARSLAPHMENHLERIRRMGVRSTDLQRVWHLVEDGDAQGLRELAIGPLASELASSQRYMHGPDADRRGEALEQGLRDVLLLLAEDIEGER